MFTKITRNQSIFLISDTEIERFNHIRKELELVTISMPAHFNRFQIWNLLIDMWLKASKDEQKLIEHPEHSLFYVVRKNIITQLFQLQPLQRMQHLTQKNDRFAYLCAQFILVKWEHFLMEQIAENKEVSEAINEILPYISQNIAGFFDPAFQELEEYPKQFVICQTKVFKLLNEIVPLHQKELNVLLDEAIQEAKDMYYLIYDAFI